MEEMIGIIVAMDSEFQMLSGIITGQSETKQFGNSKIEFYTGTLNNKRIIMCKSGIGKVNAAVACSCMIMYYSPSKIISSGVCGSLDKHIIKQGDIIFGYIVGYHDVWCGTPNELGQVQGMPENYISDIYSYDLLEAVRKDIGFVDAGEELVVSVPRMYMGIILSGDWFVDTIEKAQTICDNFGEAVGLDMESGSLAQVCEIADIPFLSVRIVSDCPLHEGSVEQYKNFWEDAPQTLVNVLCSLISNI